MKRIFTFDVPVASQRVRIVEMGQSIEVTSKKDEDEETVVKSMAEATSEHNGNAIVYRLHHVYLIASSMPVNPKASYTSISFQIIKLETKSGRILPLT